MFCCWLVEWFAYRHSQFTKTTLTYSVAYVTLFFVLLSSMSTETEGSCLSFVFFIEASACQKADLKNKLEMISKIQQLHHLLVCYFVDCNYI